MDTQNFRPQRYREQAPVGVGVRWGWVRERGSNDRILTESWSFLRGSPGKQRIPQPVAEEGREPFDTPGLAASLGEVSLGT